MFAPAGGLGFAFSQETPRLGSHGDSRFSNADAADSSGHFRWSAMVQPRNSSIGGTDSRTFSGRPSGTIEFGSASITEQSCLGNHLFEASEGVDETKSGCLGNHGARSSPSH